MIRPIVEGERGLYRFVWPEQGVVILVSRILPGRDGALTGELKIECETLTYPHLHQARLNFTSTRARSELISRLTQLHPIEWSIIIEQLCVLVLERERQGEPIHVVDGSAQPDPPGYLLYPFLPEQMPTLLYGHGGSGKSYFAVLLAVLVSSGTSHDGLGLFPFRSGPVLYLDWEATHEDFIRRVALVSRPLRTQPRVLYRFCSVPLSSDLEYLRELVIAERPALIIVDSAGLASSSELNSPDSARGLYQALRALRTTALVIHHCPKVGPLSAFGTGYFTNIARSVWELRSQSDPDAGITAMALFHKKSNFSRLERPRGIEIRFAEEGVCFRPTGIENIPVAADGAPLPILIKNLLAELGSAKAVDIAKELGASPEVVRVTLCGMRDRKEVCRYEDGRWALTVREQETIPF